MPAGMLLIKLFLKKRLRKARLFLKTYFYILNNGVPPYSPLDRYHELYDEKNIPSAEEQPVKPAVERPYRINIILFIATMATTTLVGAHKGDTALEYIASGLPYSLTIMSILLFHEMGHYFAARHFGVRATLPYFIPFPSIIGTLGAVIKTRSPIPHHRALLYIGAAGPIAGFVVSLIAVTYGISISEVKPLPTPEPGVIIPVFGDSLLFSFIVNLFHGDIPAGHDIYLSSYAWAGWIGFLITSINLIPIGQLDGGHILYALTGRKQVIFGWIAFAALIPLTFNWYGWGVWILISLFFLMIAHPPVPKGTPLSFNEKVMGWLCIIILILTFVSEPVKIL